MNNSRDNQTDVYPASWPLVAGRFWRLYLGFSIIITIAAFYLFPAKFAILTIVALALFALEFQLLAMVASIISRQVKGNWAFNALVGFGKIACWMLLVSAPFWLPEGSGKAFALGSGAFFLALFATVFTLIQWPNSSTESD